MFAETVLTIQAIALSIVFFIRLDLKNSILMAYHFVTTMGIDNGPGIDAKLSTFLTKLTTFFYILYSKTKSNYDNLNKSTATIIETAKNTYTLTYYIKDKMYKSIIKPARGPSNILVILDDDNNEVTDKVAPYLGPHNNWTHCTSLTPELIGGYKNLHIEYSDGNNKKIDRYECVN